MIPIYGKPIRQSIFGLGQSYTRVKLPPLIHLQQLVERTMVQCPHTKLCVSGYSQGSQVVHNAAEILKGDEAASNFINSVATFGDPDHKLPVGDVPKTMSALFVTGAMIFV